VTGLTPQPSTQPAPLVAAVVQTRTPADADAGWAHLEPLVRQAAAAGATLVATPEGSNLLQRDRDLFPRAVPRADDPSVESRPAALARELGITLLIGSVLVQRPEGGKAANRSLLFGPDGMLLARYDKIHLFDVSLGGLGQETRESDSYHPGASATVVQAGRARLGLTICYDLRFPLLYRQLAQAGAEVLTVPAAFTRPTGEAHWEVLLRARAIETGSFVLAPAQGGVHADGRETYGHSMIIGPWGQVLARLDHAEPGFALAALDLADVAEARRRIPAWGLDQSWGPPAAALPGAGA
jgi:predicted amidohydrolase